MLSFEVELKICSALLYCVNRGFDGFLEDHDESIRVTGMMLMEASMIVNRLFVWGGVSFKISLISETG